MIGEDEDKHEENLAIEEKDFVHAVGRMANGSEYDKNKLRKDDSRVF